MSNIIQNRIKKIQTYLANHKKTRIFVEYLFSLLGTLLSATLFAFSFRTFLSPNVSNVLTIISGGGSGLARTVACIATMINKDSDTYLIYSIANIVINIPVIYIAM